MAFSLFGKKKTNPKPAPKETPVADAVQEVAPTPSVRAGANDAILKRFFVSEKGTRALAHNQYTFEVARSATKSQVRDAVQRAYNVKVVAVNTISLPSKERRLGRFVGSRRGPKKAIVTLKEGQSIAQAQP